MEKVRKRSDVNLNAVDDSNLDAHTAIKLKIKNTINQSKWTTNYRCLVQQPNPGLCRNIQSCNQLVIHLWELMLDTDSIA